MLGNHFVNDENFAKFLKYINNLLKWRRLDYLKKLNLQIAREINLSEEDWNNLSSAENYEVDDLLEEINSLFYFLNSQEKRIISMFYIQKMTYEEIGRKLGISKDYARKVKMNALKKIKEMKGM